MEPPPGTLVEIQDAEGRLWVGRWVHERFDLAGSRVAVLRLANGYHVGIRLGAESPVRVREPPPGLARAAEGEKAASHAPVRPGSVAIVTTGGTIASRVDYETGGVSPVHGLEGLRTFYPRLAESHDLALVPLFDRLSEEFTPTDWQAIAEAVARCFAHGAKGVVVTHGTDTMALTGAALAFLCPRWPGPVVLTGAQRSSDRPSSDGGENLAAAIAAAREARTGEVLVVMHEGVADGRCAIHRATRVRKMHSTRRDAFRTRNGPPLGSVADGAIEWAEEPLAPGPSPPVLEGDLQSEARLLWFVPGLSPAAAERFVEGARGIVLAGTGLGHVSRAHFGWIRDRLRAGVPVAMTTQTLGGAVDPYVYATGRGLAELGVLYLGDMLPEVAYVKMRWVLSRAQGIPEIASLLGTDRAGEIASRRRWEYRK